MQQPLISIPTDSSFPFPSHSSLVPFSFLLAPVLPSFRICTHICLTPVAHVSLLLNSYVSILFQILVLLSPFFTEKVQYVLKYVPYAGCIEFGTVVKNNMLALLLVGPWFLVKCSQLKKKKMSSADSFSCWSALLAGVVFRSFVFCF